MSKKKYTIAKRSAEKAGATKERIEAATIAAFDTYEEAYKAARAYLDERPKRNLIFLQLWEEKGEAGERLRKEYSIIQKARAEIQARKAAETDKDPNAEIWAELGTIEGQAKRTERAERRKAAKRAARLAESKEPEDGQKPKA